MYKNIIKRFFDIVLSSIAIALTALPMLIVAIAIKVESRGSIIFKQDRIGKDKKVFKIFKFRSMCMNAEHTGSGVYSGKGDSRVTRVGRFLRATSLDELPQLFNVLAGKMSFIGPRPPLTYHPWNIEDYTEEQLRMFEVRPGITGWAQVNGRKNVEWNERIRLNVWYVDNISLVLDIKIIFKTFFKVVTNADNLSEKNTVSNKSLDENDTIK